MSSFKYLPPLPQDWLEALEAIVDLSQLLQLDQRLLNSEKKIFPKASLIFEALRLCPIADTKLVLLGQDPYHGEGEATGLCFAVPLEKKIPPSLRNLMKELQADLGQSLESTDLKSWANQGVLLLNRTLTVFENEPLSHKTWGWDALTLGCLKALILRKSPLVFLCLGKESLELIKQLGASFHPEIKVITAPHPSPLSAHRGFMGSKIFSKVNHALEELKMTPIRFGTTE
jgi:uracil-DNA glycosylase